MTPSIFAQLIFDGIAIGLVYVFMAAGFNLILSVTDVFFIAFGMFYALGAYTTWALVQAAASAVLLGCRHRHRRRRPSAGSCSTCW